METKKENFKESLRLNKEIQEAINAVSEEYKRQCRILEDEDKKKLEIYLRKLDKGEIKNER